MSFLDDIFVALDKARDTPILQEIRDGQLTSVSGGELLDMVGRARATLSGRGLKPGDRCALLAHNSIRWVAMDLAILAEGLIVVPLYARQATDELVAMMKDCAPALICCGDDGLRADVVESWPEAPAQVLFDEIFAGAASSGSRADISDSDPVTIIYTSGTSGKPKGVVLNSGNLRHMLRCTSGRLELLMQTRESGPVSKGKGSEAQERVFHYLPFCFAGSWIMLLTCLGRGSLLTLNTDLSKLSGDMRAAAPDYFLNVPALLERMRKAVDEQLWKTGGIIQFL